jgi:hypothetical protein
MQADGQTALHMAAANGHTDIVKALLASWASVSATTTVRAPVSFVCHGLQLERTRSILAPTCLQRLYVGLSHVCEVVHNARDFPNTLARSRYLGAVCFEEIPLALGCLSTVPRGISGSDVSLCGCLSLMQVDGQTALHMAARNGLTEIVKALLAAGANVSATTTVRGLVSRVCGGPQRKRHIRLFVWQ